MIGVSMLAVGPAGDAGEPVHDQVHAMGYPHLECAAGLASRLPSAALLSRRGYGHGNETADRHTRSGLRASDRADACVRAMAGALGSQKSGEVEAVYHCQATLNETITESTCLRVGYGYFSHHQRRMAVGQCGTSGVPTALSLSRLHGRGRSSLITAADSWTAPFTGRFGELADFRNGAAGMIVHAGPSMDGGAQVARIDELSHVLHPDRMPFWERPAEEVADAMARAIATAIERLPGVDAAGLDFLHPEPYGYDMPRRVARSIGREGLPALGPVDGPHAASAAFIDAVTRCVQAATEQARTMRGVIWSASPCGLASAALVTCFPATRIEQDRVSLWVRSDKDVER